eukprot:PhF_6_TR42834/c0_g1_i2/m.64868/K07152/SCO1_2; protein SCO1/2
MSRALWAGRIAGASVFPIAIGTFMYIDSQHQPPSQPTSSTNNNLRTMGTYNPTNPYTLLCSANNTTVTGESFLRDKRHWSLLYFGFAKCAEICPKSVEFMAEIAASVVQSQTQEDKIPMLRCAFVTIDPARDTVPVLNDFLLRHGTRHYKDVLKDVMKKNKNSNLHIQVPFEGYIGDDQATKAVAQQWKVFFSAPEIDEAKALGENYQLDHSSFVLLVSPEGKFVDFFTRDMPLDLVC